VTTAPRFDVAEVGDGYWTIHAAGSTRVVGTLQSDADGLHLLDEHENDLGVFARVDEALAHLPTSE
jgi:hypothetical protein